MALLSITLAGGPAAFGISMAVLLAFALLVVIAVARMSGSTRPRVVPIDCPSTDRLWSDADGCPPLPARPAFGPARASPPHEFPPGPAAPFRR